MAAIEITVAKPGRPTHRFGETLETYGPDIELYVNGDALVLKGPFSTWSAVYLNSQGAADITIAWHGSQVKQRGEE